MSALKLCLLEESSCWSIGKQVSAVETRVCGCDCEPRSWRKRVYVATR